MQTLTKDARINLLFFAVSVALAIHTVPYRILGQCPGQDAPENLVAGSATTPYQFRVLLPWIVRAGVATHLIEPSVVAERTAFGAIETVFLVLLAYVFRRYLALFIQDHVVASIAALSIYAVLPFNYFNYVFYPYDIPAALFFTLGLILLHRRNWALFYPVFIAATMNRETSIFLVAATVFVFFDSCSRRTLALLVSSQLLIWVAIKTGLWLLYGDNYGVGLFFCQLRVNVLTIVTFRIRAISALSTWGWLWVAVVMGHRRIADPFLRRNLWLVPLFVVAMLIVGFVLEVRIYGDVLPIVLSASWVVLLDVLRTRPVPAPVERSAVAGI